MIRNYIKTAFRSLKKNRGFTAINVLGLALGLATCLLIVFYVFDELGYDRYNTKADRIYRVNDDIKFNGNVMNSAISAPPLATTLERTFPEIEQAVRFRQTGRANVKKGPQSIEEHGIIFCDANVFDVFTLPMLAGDPSSALKEPNSVVITESTAKKYFNSTNVVGKVLLFDNENNYKVTGVISDIPKQSHFRFDFFISMSSLAESRDPTWLSSNFQTYILLKKGVRYQEVEKKFPQFVKQNIGVQLQTVIHASFEDFEKSGNYFKLNLIPLTKIHLQSNRTGELGQNGDIEYVYIFSAVAIFILLIACVNFMNLSTARSSTRAREVGVRKVLGSPRKYLIAQFLAESIIVTLIATMIAVFAAYALLPLFNQMSGKELVVTAHIWILLIPALLVLIIIIGCLAGSYPAFFLSAFQPIDVLKGKIAGGFKGGRLRSFLVVFQFCISIFLIIRTLVIYNQLKYIQHKDLGYNRDHVLIVQNVSALGNRAKIFKQEIKQLRGVVDATLTGYTPTSGNNDGGTIFKSPTLDAKSGMLTQLWSVDQDYVTTMGMRVDNGRNFSNQMATDSTAIVVNQTAANLLGFADPINKQLYRPQDDYGKKIKAYHIVGVIRDFNFTSLRENISPVILKFQENNNALSIRVNDADLAALLAQVKAKWKAFSPFQQFNYSFMDQDFENTYRAEQRMGTIAISFTALAILIACLGLFGLAAYAAEQRTKEIGIRKVLGASMPAIVAMLSKDFIALVAIAIIIASPLAWVVMQKWLQGFAYRQNMQWWVIGLAGLAAIFIAFGTISFQSVKAALTNPAKSLKSE